MNYVNQSKRLLVLMVALSALNLQSMQSSKGRANSEFLAAVRNRDYSRFEQALVAGADPNMAIQLADGVITVTALECVIDALHRAAKDGLEPSISYVALLQTAKKLLDSGAKVTDYVFNSVLRSINRYFELPGGREFFEALLQRRGNLDTYNEWGETPLHNVILADIATFNRPIAVGVGPVTLLIRHGVNVNAQVAVIPGTGAIPLQGLGTTPLNLAARIVRNALARTAPIPIPYQQTEDIVRDDDHESVDVDVWTENRRQAVRTLLLIMLELLNNGADPRIADHEGTTPLARIDAAMRTQGGRTVYNELHNMRTLLLAEIRRLNDRETVPLIPAIDQPVVNLLRVELAAQASATGHTSNIHPST